MPFFRLERTIETNQKKKRKMKSRVGRRGGNGTKKRRKSPNVNNAVNLPIARDLSSTLNFQIFISNNFCFFRSVTVNKLKEICSVDEIDEKRRKTEKKCD